MRKGFLHLLFFFFPLFVFAQAEVGKVRAGIQSLTVKVCTYKSAEDSSGLHIVSVEKYDANGKPLQTVREERSSDYGYGVTLYSLDTTCYTYNAEGKPVLIKSSNERTVFKYDRKGNCIAEKNYAAGEVELNRQMKYNSEGKLLAVYETADNGELVLAEECEYTAEGQLSARRFYVFPETDEIGDSILYSYSPKGKTELTYTKNGTYTRAVYDAHDSLISSASYERRKKPVYALYCCDSISITRDSLGRRESFYRHEHVFPTERFGTDRVTKEKYQNGLPERRITDLGSQDANGFVPGPVYLETFEYTVKGQLLSYRKTQDCKPVAEWHYTYNPAGELLERRAANGKGQLLARTVYEYTYY